MSDSKNLQSSRWATEIRATIETLEAAIRTLAKLRNLADKGLVTRDALAEERFVQLGEIVAQLEKQLNAALQTAKSSFDRYSGHPVAHLFAHKSLSREEYFLLQAMGATAAELPEPSWPTENAS